MIPIYLDPVSMQIMLIGRGAAALRRLQWLRDGGAAPSVWSDAPEPAFASAAPNLNRRLPTSEEIGACGAVWIADLSADEARPLAEAARAAGVLVNVEDVVALCDFHSPAVVRRGKLTLAVGTGGASPAAARAAREQLEEAFPESWAEALDEIAASRAALRAEQAPFDALVADARGRLTRRGLI